ncbi:TetR/AcrR family transcriptional regulator [Maribacter hydrothermalis]|uniref:TetR family transcriptional regulator n=1 Tax=Maribacter hydrothermalis TaxID=1836467 RepID=A0A1B7ZER1_9FLAO|nr:TetR/AcrR family transcriptional regulator [Maribacter hydrothermalis]APQ17546.1 TetR family transcriptional regulator [Maribacter hydrothermalis]OBR42021.1 TetR family transcriptional regulator [Maribacter hydrothermalis]
MKEKIRDTASQLFLERGFKSITMDDIANEIGMSKKTIYSEYSNKTSLVEDCVMNKFCDLSDGIDLIIAMEKNAIEELYEIKKYVMSHLNDEKSSPQYQLMKYYPKIHKNLKIMQFDKMHNCILLNVERGLAQGLFRNNIEPEFVARIYFTGMNSIKDQSIFPINRFPISRLMDAFLEYHLRGIVTPKGKTILNNIINSNQE